ncbi:hypothetical protein EXIGLDRAFT_726668 [Exidia glandulosa HHB12029]|uniref:DRBM domain-containing protein n=1 Tax=Exidia glandulosa HHB12029 TaxID=1314781 RepID=A0A165DMI0_EXIGL|nr:hypothetical protein EXIGLDRAFT_726668 [Exidia glandulosa HHB12029]
MAHNPHNPQIPQNAHNAQQGYVQRLNNHYQGPLRLSPQTYIYYDVQLAEGSTFVATVWLRNFNPPAYYVGRGIGQMAAKESAAFTAGRALGLW